MKDTEVIISELYPFVKKALDKNSKKFLDNIAIFINKKHEQLFDIAPYYNILFNQSDVDAMYRSLGFTERDILPICQNIWYWNKNINPVAAKTAYELVIFCAIRYFLKMDQTKNAELTAIYMCFSGKFYASIFFREWKYAPGNSKSVMDFVINNMLSDKFDLKKEGSIFKAVQKMCITWMNTYKSQLIGSPSDDDCRILIQQLRDRLSSFLKNIAKLFYEAYENKYYLNYEVDDIDPDSFHLTDNDAATAARITANTMSILTSQKVDLSICRLCKNENVKEPDEIRAIMETILGNNDNIPSIRRLINIIICDFMENNRGYRVGSDRFVRYSLQSKPNTKSEILLEMKSIITKWLDENSENYRRRKSREATANNYYKSVLGYFVWTIVKAANK